MFDMKIVELDPLPATTSGPENFTVHAVTSERLIFAAEPKILTSQVFFFSVKKIIYLRGQTCNLFDPSVD